MNDHASSAASKQNPLWHEMAATAVAHEFAIQPQTGLSSTEAAICLYVPVLQSIFKTEALILPELTLCTSTIAVVFFAKEIEKRLVRHGKLYQNGRHAMTLNRPFACFQPWQQPCCDKMTQIL
ncbi:hypothetical protein CAP31_12835 [Sulfuriferula sp. AH1]|uniref:hypothetical protein n=1 Tax=Sulfuriferula sp. AH1 TaxID=1985873 RepID=UPI000B3B8AF8|nr:hypothetical protein [Sulfuriferula sp. AH1]ARU32485.1 hypothetical protein CAP31_12835 [Sulfuriferula sp. AH1]